MKHGHLGKAAALLRTNPWVVFLLPFLAFLALTSLEPKRPDPMATVEAKAAEGRAVTSEEAPEFARQVQAYRRYPIFYALKIAFTVGAIAFVWPGYRQFPCRLSPLAIIAGVVGIVVWVGLWKLDLETRLGLRPLLESLQGRRSAFNPAEMLADPLQQYAFIAVRLFGLALVVPLVEEMFYRGFLMRFVVDKDWPRVPMGKVTPLAAAAAILLPMLSHPEVLAAAAWFGGMVWLYHRTKNIWDCVAAHAVTNLLLGVYVLASGDPRAWELW